MIAWASLLLSSFFEIAWAISMKYSAGFTKLGPSLVTILTASLSVFFLSYALKQIPISIGYPIWMGIGVVGVVLVGMFWFKEPASMLRIACILMILAGSFGLKAIN